MSDVQMSGLYAQAKTALETSDVISMRRLRVEQVGESLVLTGRVPTFYQKQMAQEIVRTVAAECELVNSIDVD
jgi:osmotically-inducible protein OsmY